MRAGGKLNKQINFVQLLPWSISCTFHLECQHNLLPYHRGKGCIPYRTWWLGLVLCHMMSLRSMCILLQFLFLQVQLLVDTVFLLCDGQDNIVLFLQQVYASPTAFRCVRCPFFGRTHKTPSYCAVPRASCCASCCLGDRFYRDSIISLYRIIQKFYLITSNAKLLKMTILVFSIYWFYFIITSSTIKCRHFLLTNSNFALPKVQFLFGLPVPTDSSIWKPACLLFLTSINSSSGSSILHKEHFQYRLIIKMLFIDFPPEFPLRNSHLTRLC